MKSPRFWGYMYLFMGFSFVYLAIQQSSRSGTFDLFTIALMAIAAYDFMIGIRYLTLKPKTTEKKDD
ncbi:hypothetical protein BKP35_04365 [Anaerobacillus arseniciselenatis]|uniref:DUF4305 domain-containing protein n=1 Tax=Anaerobacillus arseniciselenatis TaxID=85682 RepID=A0A1S2LX36_9BACI|nr:YdiK family protein [Anaerobacillus arseniciselenatis]OIJ16217.1 hypothetical protein BKP35_04365 [Anaerobacillus arseniciselenatis]